MNREACSAMEYYMELNELRLIRSQLARLGFIAHYMGDHVRITIYNPNRCHIKITNYQQAEKIINEISWNERYQCRLDRKYLHGSIDIES